MTNPLATTNLDTHPGLAVTAGPIPTSKHKTGRGAISIRNLTKIYDPGGVNVLAVDDCSMEIAPGEVCMIVGPSGCGKTTLLNAIAGFHSITSGEIWIDGEMLCGPGKPMANRVPTEWSSSRTARFFHGRRWRKTLLMAQWYRES